MPRSANWACTRALTIPAERSTESEKRNTMAKRGFSVIDTELHLEEPLDLFDQNLEEPYRSMTRVAGPPEGRLKDGGKRFELGGKVGDNSVNESAQLVQKQSARRLREEPRLLKARTDCRPDVYLEGMDVEGGHPDADAHAGPERH